MSEKTLFIKVGDFFFKYRNFAFPVVLVALFALYLPPKTLFGSEHLENIKDVLAILISASGLLVRAIVIGYAYIKRGGLQKKVYADKLVTEGMFNLCRNPLYVGNMLIYTGIFLLHGNIWVVIIGTSLFFAIYQSIIAAEEYFLRNKFGDDYINYCKEVSRWIPNLAKFRYATRDMDFSIKRIVAKDYSTIANSLGIIILLIGYENLTEYPFKEVASDTYLLSGLLAFVVTGAFIIRYFKKQGRLVS